LSPLGWRSWRAALKRGDRGRARHGRGSRAGRSSRRGNLRGRIDPIPDVVHLAPTIENEQLDCADYPSEGLICTIARVLGACEDERLPLAQKIPPAVRRRGLESPDAFRRPARLDGRTLDRLLRQVAE
jgi:hypothetical protein